MKNELFDAGAERALIGTIVKNGKDTFVDSSLYVGENDFYLNINKVLYKILFELNKDETCKSFDIESIRLKAKSLNVYDQISEKDNEQYLILLLESYFDNANLPMFALQVKKLSIVRQMHSRYKDAVNYLENINTNETLSNIMQHAEGLVVEAMSGEITGDKLTLISEGIDEYIEEIINSEPVDQVGISTGFNLYDEAIGGGPRPGTVSIIGARAKVGKSFLSMNMARNVANQGIPVLYLDTELTEKYQKDRLICMDSECPIFDFERSRFKNNPSLVNAVRSSAKTISEMPLYYESISGKTNTEALNVARRWITRHVGFDENGHANPCLIIYDYLKLMNSSELGQNSPEYIVLGLLLTELHNFALRYNVPVISLVQLNREGIDGENASVIAGSDRILWLCSSFSILKNKTDEDVAMGCGYENGNKKLLVVDTRHGSGMELEKDYINLKCSLRPNVSKDNACGRMTEGMLFSQVAG